MAFSKFHILLSLYSFLLFSFILTSDVSNPNKIIEVARIYKNDTPSRNRSRRNRSRSNRAEAPLNESEVVNEISDNEAVSLVIVKKNEDDDMEELERLHANLKTRAQTGDLTHGHKDENHTHIHNHTHSHNHSYIRSRSLNKTDSAQNETFPIYNNNATANDKISQTSGAEPIKIEVPETDTPRNESDLNNNFETNKESESLNITNLVGRRGRGERRQGNAPTNTTEDNITVSQETNETINETSNTNNTYIEEALTSISLNLSSEPMKEHYASDQEYNSRIYKQRSYEDLLETSTESTNETNTNNITTPVNNTESSSNFTATYNITGRYMIPKNSNLTEEERVRMRHNLEEHAQEIRRSRCRARRHLRKELGNANKRLKRSYNEMRRKYRDQEDRRQAFKARYEKQRREIETAYRHAEERIRVSAEKSMDEYAVEQGFEKVDGENDLTVDQYEFQEELNKTLTDELDHLEDVKNEELENLDKTYNEIVTENHLATESNENTTTDKNITNIGLLQIKTKEKTVNDSKLYKTNLRAVILLLIILICCAVAAVVLNMNRKKQALHKKVDDITDESTYILIR